MRDTEQYAGKSIVSHALVILPAVALGVLGMLGTGVRSMLWGQQIAAYVIFALLACVLRKAARKVSPAVWIAVLYAFLAATLLFPAVGGAKRWLDLGIFNVHAAMLVLPAMLILLSHTACAWPLLLCTAGVLCIQPDLAQLAAFAAASLVILWQNRKRYGWSVLCAAAQAAMVVICLRIPTEIESVSYSEGILMMLGELSPLLLPIGVFALVLIPGAWGYRFFKARSLWMLSLTVYYVMIILFGLTGEYPMPFMGFGLSPIVGYWLAVLLIPDAEEK